MSDQQRPRTDLRALLESVEAAPPSAAIEVVTHELAVMVGARAVSFLIADFSGRAVVRFGRAEPGVDTADSRGVRSRETVQLADTVYERVLRTQQVDVHGMGDGARLILPVTDRGDAIGVLELILPRYPDAQVVADVAAAAHALSYVVVANRPHTDLFEWGQRTTIRCPPSHLAAIDRVQTAVHAGQVELARRGCGSRRVRRGQRVDAARTRLAYDEHLRRARRRIDARVHLRAAIAVFDDVGARRWAEPARQEARPLSRPRADTTGPTRSPSPRRSCRSPRSSRSGAQSRGCRPAVRQPADG